MIRVLVVDDQFEKAKAISGCLLSVEGFTPEGIEECSTAFDAKSRLVNNRYDLLVIDIALPIRCDGDPADHGGRRLLEEITERPKYLLPQHIIGITRYRERYAKAEARFKARCLTVIHYDECSTEWAELLRAKAEHVVWARESDEEVTRQYESELAVVCALDDPELASVRRLPWNWAKHKVSGDHTIYYRGHATTGCSDRAIYAAAAAQMGLTSTAVLAVKMIQSFRPRYLAMVGITAGREGRANIGDVVAAESSWDYGSGKYEVIDGIAHFVAAPNQYHMAPEIRSKIVDFAKNEELLASISAGWPGDRPSTQLRLILGPVASGAAVIADPERAGAIKEQHRKLVGIEMETYSVFAAAAECAAPRPLALSFKSVTDFADARKSDLYQRYAAYTSAEVLRRFFEEYL